MNSPLTHQLTSPSPNPIERLLNRAMSDRSNLMSDGAFNGIPFETSLPHSATLTFIDAIISAISFPFHWLRSCSVKCSPPTCQQIKSHTYDRWPVDTIKSAVKTESRQLFIAQIWILTASNKIRVKWKWFQIMENINKVLHCSCRLHSSILKSKRK